VRLHERSAVGLSLSKVAVSLTCHALSGPPLHSLDIEDCDRAGLEPDPATCREVGKRLVYGLS
jgi:hypothetical protein